MDSVHCLCFKTEMFDPYYVDTNFEIHVWCFNFYYDSYALEARNKSRNSSAKSLQRNVYYATDIMWIQQKNL